MTVMSIANTGMRYLSDFRFQITQKFFMSNNVLKNY